MKKYFILVLVISLFPELLFAQERLAASSVWYAKVLREWFPEKIKVNDSTYYTTRIRCSNKDLTHFKAEAGKTNVGFGSAFHIKGSLTLDPLPAELKTFRGAQGQKYLLLFQGLLFSSEGKVLWSQQGYPKGDAWVNAAGSTTQFNLIGSYGGSLKGCTAAVLAAGDPISIDGSVESRVILGMKRFSFRNDAATSGYDPSVSSPQAVTQRPPKPTESKQPKKLVYGNLQYIEKKHSGWTYTEVTGVPTEVKKRVFRDIVDYEDRTGNSSSSHKAVAKRYGLPEKAVDSIAEEGLVKRWLMQ
ncbi:hypothetical protein ACFLU6_04245 [Acidobacteriota bacterium]